MGIPLAIFYYIYLGLAAIFLVLSLLAIWHLVRYSKMDLVSIIIILFYLVVAAMIFTISWQYINQIDWNQNITITSGLENPEQDSRSNIEL